MPVMAYKFEPTAAVPGLRRAVAIAGSFSHAAGEQLGAGEGDPDGLGVGVRVGDGEAAGDGVGHTVPVKISIVLTAVVGA